MNTIFAFCSPMSSSIAVLPIDALIPKILASLHRSPNVVVEAAPGAEKPPRVPPALLAFGGDVLVLEPRRIAARMAARRVAAEMGEGTGETVGYQVRFEEAISSRTRLLFLTEGVLTRRMISDPLLDGVGVVVLDEFHERHLETDLALALCGDCRKRRGRICALSLCRRRSTRGLLRRFSATARCCDRKGGCSIWRSRTALFGRRRWKSRWRPRWNLRCSENAGDVLVFLPGAAEIRQAARRAKPLAHRHDLLVTPLYGDLPPAEQDRAVEPSSQRKVILSTNIAESSLTIEGVRIVIDSGLARIASDSPWTGLPSLEVKRISKAAAGQRAGRAGRTGPGRVIRLYTMEDFQRRADHDAPEIERRELSQMCLQLEAAGVHDPLELDFLDKPPESALAAAESLLDRLDARGAAAEKMARLPLHPRLARLVMEGGERGCRVAALLSSGQRVQSSDLFHALDEPWDGRTRAVFEQLRRYARGEPDDAALARAVLAAFPDRVGRRRAAGTVLLSNGSSATMLAPAASATSEFIVAMDVEDRGERP